MANYPQSSLIAKFFSQGQPMVFGKGDVILGNEIEPNGIYYVSSGYVKIYSISDDGDEFLHIIYGHGEMFPITWAYTGLFQQSMFYEALTECVVWRISREWFIRKISTDVDTSVAIGMQMAHQFSAFDNRLENLEYKKASERVAYRLLFLASRFGTREGTAIVIQAPITHELLANSINLVRESVSREFEELEHLRIIKRSHRLIHILDIDSLVHRLSEPPDFQNWHLIR